MLNDGDQMALGGIIPADWQGDLRDCCNTEQVPPGSLQREDGETAATLSICNRPSGTTWDSLGTSNISCGEIESGLPPDAIPQLR